MPLATRKLVVHQDLPETVLADLHARRLADASRSLKMVQELLSIQGLLGSSGLRPVPFKGVSLAASVYGDVTLRTSTDIDLILSPDEAIKARSLLKKEGFVGGPTALHEPAYQRANNEFSLFRPSDRLIVELQWAIVPRYLSIPLQLGPMLEHLVSVEIGGQYIPALADDDLLVVLLVHAAKHRWERLIWICDIAQLVTRGHALAWDRLFDTMRRSRIERLVLVGLRLARQLQANLNLPDEVLRLMHADPSVERRARQIWSGVIDGNPSRHSPLISHIDLGLREDMGDRARILWRLAVTPTQGDWDQWDHPQSAFAYGLHRPWRLWKKYGGRVVPSWARPT